MTDSERLGAVCETLAARGYELDRREGYAVAVPTDDTDAVGVSGPLHVVDAAPEPVAVLEVVGQARRANRTALFAAHPIDAAAVREVLTAPPGLRTQDDTGRTFYNGPDRLPAGDLGWACCRADESPVWREEAADGVTGEGSRFVCYADDSVVTAFDTAENLSCPRASAFPYAYDRDENGRFRVRELDGGRTVGRFNSVTAMKDHAYRPIPAPLVPEEIVGDDHIPEAWTLATVEEGRVVEIAGA
jgi:hypothetical protein